MLVVASTSRTDAIDPSLVVPGRLDHLIEIPLPDTPAQQQILAILQRRGEREAGQTLFEPLDEPKILPMIGGEGGAHIAVDVRPALEPKVRRAAPGPEAAGVTAPHIALPLSPPP